ncbi:hypothetical protein MPSEU_000140200 [Mayamaea pseudoterrestris]|nr:hypothetical protein MPSEU_000140200 [Mayamaea pseudoterrestris]
MAEDQGREAIMASSMSLTLAERMETELEMQDRPLANEIASKQGAEAVRRQKEESLDDKPKQESLGNAANFNSTMAPDKANMKNSTTRGRLVYNSPRIRYSDAILFPAASLARQQWQQQQTYLLNAPTNMYQQYFRHQNVYHGPPPHVLSLGARRCLTLETLKAGMPRRAAFQITELHLHFSIHETKHWKAYEWNDWWMGIAKIFANVHHLYIEHSAVEHGHDDEEEEDAADCALNLKGKTRRRLLFPWSRALANDKPCTVDHPEKELEQTYLRNSRSERLEVLMFLPNLKSFNGTAFTPDDYQTTQQYHSVGLFVPSVQKVQAQTPTMLPAHTYCLLDQEIILADDDDANDCDDDDDLDLEMEAIREILEATKSLDDVEFTNDRITNTKQSKPPVEEKKEDDATPGTPPRRPTKQHDVELEYVSPETNAVTCEWGVACGSLSLPTYFLSTNSMSSGTCTRLRFRPRTRASPAPTTGIFYAAAKDAMNAKRSTTKSIADVYEPNLNAELANDPGKDGRPEAKTRMGSSVKGISLSENVSPSSAEACTINYQQSPLEFATEHPNSSHALNTSSHNSMRTPAHASLSSPFPMQFRARAKQAIFAAKYKIQGDLLSSIEPGQEIRSSPIMTNSVEILREPIPLPRAASPPLGAQKKAPQVATPPKAAAKLPAKVSSRPPPGPRRATSTVAAKAKKKVKKHRGPKWREKVAARSSSILDESEDEDNIDDENADDASSTGIENIHDGVIV